MENKDNGHSSQQQSSTTQKMILLPVQLPSNIDKMGSMDDTNMSDIYPSRPFTRSQAKDLQGLQAMFMKREALEELEGHQRRTYNVCKVHQNEKEEGKRPCVQMAIS
ncbi:hypothetical protein KY290_010833 [Solanum tuberosum]|uniref:Uncharacterized protein n=1 Tax=Solanum tuberosum TaxID=4113 RepID=A0ABQ7VYX2_SOLTU|nr:hypothetical protein KY290_010833 [Solanum tuberosum]